jgi:hypothetical protein
MLLFSTRSTATLGPTQWVFGSLSSEVKRPQRETDSLRPPSAVVFTALWPSPQCDHHDLQSLVTCFVLCCRAKTVVMLSPSKGSLPWLQCPATGAFPKPDKSSPHSR